LTIEDILDEENILEDLRLSSKKFSDLYGFFHVIFEKKVSSMGTNPDFIKQMITYIISEPDLSRNPKFFQKFPFNSSEIFFLELEEIINAFFPQNVEANESKIVKTEMKKSLLEEEPHNANVNNVNDIENSDMMEKCMGYSNPVCSPKKEKKDYPDDDLMEQKMTAFKPLDNNHFDPFKYASHQSLAFIEKTGTFELLDHLFSFLENSEKQLNLTMAGYFAKCLHALMNKRFMDVKF